MFLSQIRHTVLERQVKGYLKALTWTIMIYLICSFLGKSIMHFGWHFLTYLISPLTFIEYLSYGFVFFIFSRFVLETAFPERKIRRLYLLLDALLSIHVVMLILSQVYDIYYTIKLLPVQNEFVDRVYMNISETEYHYLSYIPSGLMIMTDVSGKGIPAALFMMSSKMVIQNHIKLGKSPKEALEAANEELCRNNPECMFATAWLGILDVKSGRLTAANAGHQFPVVKSPKGSFQLLKDKHGLMLGYRENVRYTEYEIMPAKGSKLFIYTDGIPEAENGKNEFFGMDRMVTALNEAKDESPEMLLKAVRSSIDGFVQGSPQFDDITHDLCPPHQWRRTS